MVFSTDPTRCTLYTETQISKWWRSTNVLGLRYKRNKVAARVIRIDQLSPDGRQETRGRGATKIKDFAFFLFIAGLKVNFFCNRARERGAEF